MLNVEDISYTRSLARSQDFEQFSITSNRKDGFQHSLDPRILSPLHLKCRLMVVERTPACVLDSLLLSAEDAEHNPGPTKPHYACGVATKTKGMECMKCGGECHRKCSNLTINEAALCQWLKSFVCNRLNSRALDRERCSACGRGFRHRQYRAICDICNSP